jgi:hypothetical protein
MFPTTKRSSSGFLHKQDYSNLSCIKRILSCVKQHFIMYQTHPGHVVVQLVGALRYKTGSSRVRLQGVIRIFH